MQPLNKKEWRTGLLLAAFVLIATVAVQTFSGPLPSNPSQQKIAFNFSHAPTQVLGEKIPNNIIYLKIEDLEGPVYTAARKGEFIVQSMHWLPDQNNQPKKVALVVPVDESATKILESLKAGTVFKLVTITSPLSDVKSMVWKLTNATLNSYTLSGQGTGEELAQEIIFSAGKVTQLITDLTVEKQIDCALFTDQPSCNETQGCSWLEPKKANGLKNVVQVQGVCQPSVPPPVSTTTVSTDPDITRVKNPTDTTNVTGVTTRDSSSATQNTDRSSGSTGGGTSGSSGDGGGTSGSSGSTGGDSSSSGSTSGGSTSGSSGDSSGSSGGNAASTF